MKPVIQRRFVFVAKSMLWSLLLYTVFMVALNWDDVSNKVRGVNPITVITNVSSQPPVISKPAVVTPSISRGVGVIRGLINLVSSVSGSITSH